MRPSQKQRRWLRLVWVPAGLAVLAELAFRLAVPMDALVYQDSLNPILRFELRPDSEGTKAGAWVKINSRGLRDDEVPLEKPPGEFRVVTVGGHLTFGLGVPVEQGYVRLLREKLKSPRIRRVRTINLSMYHYNLSQKLELLRTRGVRYEPDFVIFQVYPDDIRDLPQALLPLPRAKNFVRSHSRLVRWSAESLFWSRTGPSGPPGPTPIRDQLQRLRDLLVRELGIPVLVVYLPNLALKDPASLEWAKAIQTEFRSVCQEMGLPYDDLTQDLRSHAARSILLHPDEPWLNAVGHRLAAESMVRRIRPMLEKLRKPVRPPRVS